MEHPSDRPPDRDNGEPPEFPDPGRPITEGDEPPPEEFPDPGKEETYGETDPSEE